MNKKTLFLVITLITMLILVTSVNAATDNTNTSTTHSISEKTTTTEPVVKEKIENTQTKEKTDKTRDKTITKTNKTQKNTKTTTRTIEVTNTEELVQVILDQVRDNENDEYIINLKQGTYTLDGDIKIISATSNIKKVTYNGNNSIINCESATVNAFKKNHELILKDLVLNGGIDNEDGKLTVINCTINADWVLFWGSGAGVSIFNDDCTLNIGDEVWYQSDIIYTNDTVLINKLVAAGAELGVTINPEETSDNKIIENTTINTPQQNNINLTYVNCQINAKITNNGNLTLVNCSLSNNKMTTSGSKTDGFLLENKGNLTMIDCVMENNTFNSSTMDGYKGNGYIYDFPVGSYKVLNGAIYNTGVLSIKNSSFSNNTLGFFEGGYYAGIGSVLTNNGSTYIEDSTFNSNYAGIKGGVISSYGNAYLNVNNSNFDSNYASVCGGAINVDTRVATWNSISPNSYSITNSNFTNNKINRTLSDHRNSGAAIFIDEDNLGVIENCSFKNNKASGYGGAVSITEGTATIRNNLFDNNTAGNGILKCGKDTVYQFYTDNDILIDNCTFINNNANDVLYTEDNTTVSNNLFENNTGNPRVTNSSIIHIRGYTQFVNNTIKNNSNTQYIYYNNIGLSLYEWGLWGNKTTIYSHKANETITDNIFTDNKATIGTIFTLEPDNITKTNNKYTNTSIDDIVTLNLPQKIYTGEPITITGTYVINNPQDYDADLLEENQFQIYVNDELVDTIDTINFTITPTTGTMRIIVKPTISQTEKTSTIRATTITDIIITPVNYDEYIYKGSLDVPVNSKVIFQGTFNGKDILIPVNDIVIDGTQAKFTNTVFTLEATGITLQNMNISNTETDYPIINTADNNIITQNMITIANNEGKTAAIYNKANNTTITYNTLIVDGPALTIDHTITSAANTQAILLIGGYKNTIEYNNIEITSTTTSEEQGTIEAITNYQEAINTVISNNDITVTGNGKFNYGINSLKNVQNLTITDNNIFVTGERYTDGIQVGNNAENILIKNNTIKCICRNNTPVDEEAITYGIITSNMGTGKSNNITITENNIDLTGSVNYGIEVYQTTNTLIKDNIINVNGLQSMGIGYAHSPNSTVTGNIIKTSGDSTIPLTSITEEIRPANVGIQIQQDSDNILIEDNTIQTYDKGAQDTCININTTNVAVRNNNLTSSTKTGENTITTTQPDTILDNNNAIEQESTTQTTTEDLTTGDNTTLTAQFYDDTYTPVGDGKAIFRVNGKTLRDNQGNVIYADVINGRAELPDVNITQEWTKEGTTIQAVYVGDDNNDPITTTPTTINVTKPEATITLDAPSTATAGQEITLKATVTDGDTAIISGRVAFKLNGKTLKDPKTGKALYANVENGVATITYTIPAKTKVKEYTLTAVFTDNKYDRVEAESKLNVVKA